jgi:hypothetical protein
MRLHVRDQQPGQRRHRDVDQEPDGHVLRLEVDPDHRPELEVDEKE